jgi:AraC-like DNA-binding protein
MELNFFNNLVDELNLFIGFLSFIIAIVHMLDKNKKPINYIIIFIYLCYSFIIICFSFETSGRLFKYPHLVGVYWPFMTFVAPAFYLYIKILTNHSYKITKKHLVLFLPGILFTIALIPTVFVLSAPEKIKLLLEYDKFDFLGFLILIFFNTTVLFFVILSLYEIRILLSREKIKNTVSFRITFFLCVLGALGVVINCIGAITESRLMLRIDSIIFNIVLITPFLVGYRYPNFMHTLSLDISKEKYKKSQIDGIVTDSVVSRLEDLFEVEKIFKDPELNITKISEELEITRHQLSEILNSEIGVNYNTYVNKFRIEEAKKNLIDEPYNSILQIAYSVGFNSKTAFNTAFKKNILMTPTEYRKMNLIN